MAVHTFMEGEGDVTLEQIATALSGAGAGIFGTLLTGAFGRRKNRADAAAVLTQAAAGLVEPLRKELAETRADFAEHKRSDAEREHRRREALAHHTVWDNEVAQRLEDLGYPVGPPPALE